MEPKIYHTYVCPTRIGKNDKIETIGCGGRWGPEVLERCPKCKGPLLKLQETLVVSLYET